MSVKPIHPDDLFNGYIGANVVFACQQIGLFSVLSPDQKKKPQEIAEQTKSDLSRLEALLQASYKLGYVVYHPDGSVSISQMGEVLRTKLGYFTWGVGGYGDMLRNMGSLTTGDKRWQHLRHEDLVALGSEKQGAILAPILYKVMDTFSFSHIADFGCGNGGRLVSLCQRYPHCDGIGIDVSASAIRLADENVRRHSLQKRLTMLNLDVLEVFQSPQYADMLSNIDLVISFLMLHDLYNLPQSWPNLFDRLREVFPRVKYFLIADTVKMPALEELDSLPIFSVGYELLHSFMDVNLPTKTEYDEAFTKAGLTVETCIDFGMPYTYLYLLKA